MMFPSGSKAAIWIESPTPSSPSTVSGAVMFGGLGGSSGSEGPPGPAKVSAGPKPSASIQSVPNFRVLSPSAPMHWEPKHVGSTPDSWEDAANASEGLPD